MTFKFDSSVDVPAADPWPDEARHARDGDAIDPVRRKDEARVDASNPAPGGLLRTDARRVLLVGSPNVGKSVLFGALTGTYVTVSNYPGTTVEVTRGRAAVPRAGGADASWEVLDTPGTNHLVPMSEDEAVTRDILLSEPHDALVQVGDAKNLSRTLLMTLQLAELGIPFLLNLNMLDEARARGIRIDGDRLRGLLPEVGVNFTAAVRGEGIDGVRAYLAAAESSPKTHEGAPRRALPCAPTYPEDVEAALDEIASHLPATITVAPRGVAAMLLAGDRGLAGWLTAHVGEAVRKLAGDRARELEARHGLPAFALLSKHRLARAQGIVREVISVGASADPSARGAGTTSWPKACALGAASAVVAAITYDGALTLTQRATAPGDPLEDYSALSVVARLFSPRLFEGWTAAGLALLLSAAVLGAWVVHRHAQARAALWKHVTAFAAGYGVFWALDLAMALSTGKHPAWPLHAGAIAGTSVLAAWARSGDSKDPAVSRFFGRYATHPQWGLPLLAVVLFFAYKVVGVFGAGTAVDFLEGGVFGGVSAQTAVESVKAPDALYAGDDAANGAQRLLPVDETPPGGPTRVRLHAQIKRGGAYVPDPAARIDVYAKGAIETAPTPDGLLLTGDLRGAEARIWTGLINRWAFAGFFALGIPFLTAIVVGPYGLLTMGLTYAVAIVLPVVATFFFVFSMLEDSGYLPRLAVMANRQLRTIGLNGKAVLPMVLGLGCDTMATLTARIMETKKERVLVTLLLALGIPCSSQLSVIFAMMQRTSGLATLIWVAVVLFTIFVVGWVSARVIPGDRSDFVLEMPPLRRPLVSNLAAKTMARIEWYLREAVPLFIAGTLLLFFLDRFSLLGLVHAAGEPVVHHIMGFGRDGGVSDRVSEALLIGFLRRDFGAAGLLDLTRGGHLSTADIAVSMVCITLFIPCIANVFMIVKERGWKVAGLMCAFIFPYAIAMGALIRLLFRAIGSAG